MKLKLSIKRAYDPTEPADGCRILVDRLWPRGIKKDAAHVDMWAKDAAPSAELRTWFGHDPDKWEEFQERYTQELDNNHQAWEPILARARDGHVTLVYGAKDIAHNNAIVLQKYLERQGRRAERKAAHAEG